MGAAESRAQVTPSRPIQNRHLSHVTDPRSPTAGIMRTPIEVGDSPKRTIMSEQDEEEAVEPTDFVDPRSPTHGIVRTPLRPSLHDSLSLLAKQLSEVFVLEDSVVEGSPAADVESPAAASEEQAASDLASTPVSRVKETEETAVESPAIQAAAPAEPTPPVLQQQKQRGKSPHGSGSKNVRQRPRKALISSAPGRSPLKILQEDNSPSTAVQNRQIKKISSFQSDPPSSLRSLKISHSGWEMSHNKENAHYIQSES
ncbi:PREDICTED: cell division cycle-associated protein 3 [Nanorana parkeri]|uniref:cell division cycle-associated protein 3 n=1 Tax=Nanorana parkeri TaxID=125878 RepID=UPI0008550ACF|nr:PREDICTED: cell division cycle-associated protein 3 [Nanorana parkeri]